MHDEIAHMGVIDRLLSFRLPGSIGGGVVGINADDVELVEIPEFDTLQIGELAAEDEMQQLFALALIRHLIASLDPRRPERSAFAGAVDPPVRPRKRLDQYAGGGARNPPDRPVSIPQPPPADRE